jgi:ribosomal protein S18
MVSFIRKFSVFVFISIVVLAIIVIVPFSIIKQKARFEINDSAKIAIFGHSHAECAYDDVIIPNFKNLASSGESYFYTFQKLKKTLSQNPEIETVFVEFTNNQIDQQMDEWIWGYDKMSFYLPVYLPFIEYKDLEILNNHNATTFRSTISVASRKNLIRFLKSEYDYSDEIGGFTSLNVSVVDRILDTLNPHKKLKKTYSTSTVNLHYLRKIIDYCRSEGKVVFLVRTPQHKNYKMLENEDLFLSVRKSHFSDVDFIDFNNNNLPNNYYSDLEHLNGKGATVLSKKLKRLIEEGLISSKEKFFIDRTFHYFISY